MNRALVVRYRTTADRAEENEQLVKNVYAELAATGPEGLRYLTLRLDDGVTFVHVAMLDVDDEVLPQLPAFQEFQRRLGDRLEAAPDAAPAVLIGSYRAFG